MEQARPDSTLLPTAQVEAEHQHDGIPDRDARIERLLIEAPTETEPHDGEIVGARRYGGIGPDLSRVAEGWLEDARALGMLLHRQPDGSVWRAVPVNDGLERRRAREAHWVKLNDHPRLLRAVYAAVRRGFEPDDPEEGATVALTPQRDVVAEIRAAAEAERDRAAAEAIADAGLTSEISEEVRAAIENHRDVMRDTEARTEAGLALIDGQHSAIAAETHPLIEMIPVVVVDATAQADRAQAFHAAISAHRAAYSPVNRAVPGRGWAAHAIREAADNACNNRLTELHRDIEGLLPDLFGPAGENPEWAVAMGVNLGLVETNPALRVHRIRKATGERHRNRPWSVAERDVVLAAAPIQLKAPLAFMRYLGARLGDVRAMPATAYQDGMITFRTGKGDVEVCVPCPGPLAARHVRTPPPACGRSPSEGRARRAHQRRRPSRDCRVARRGGCG